KRQGHTPLRVVGVNGHLVNCAAIHRARNCPDRVISRHSAKFDQCLLFPRSGHRLSALRYPLRANSGLMRRSIRSREQDYSLASRVAAKLREATKSPQPIAKSPCLTSLERIKIPFRVLAKPVECEPKQSR